jgi:hypothetical protein
VHQQVSGTLVLECHLTQLVGFGLEADIRAAKCHVRFTPKADIFG